MGVFFILINTTGGHLLTRLIFQMHVLLVFIFNYNLECNTIGIIRIDCQKFLVNFDLFSFFFLEWADENFVLQQQRYDNKDHVKTKPEKALKTNQWRRHF